MSIVFSYNENRFKWEPCVSINCDTEEEANYVDEALEKQWPKKIHKQEFQGEDFDYYKVLCPRCQKQLRPYEKANYCPECGQRLDWSDEN